MFRAIMDYLGYVQTWIWIWGFASHLQEWTAPMFPGRKDEHALMRAILDEKLRRMHTIAGRDRGEDPVTKSETRD
jgi:hypothetical protein